MELPPKRGGWFRDSLSAALFEDATSAEGPLSTTRSEVQAAKFHRPWKDPIRGGQKRIEIIKTLGLDAEEELQLIGMVNDPLVVDLFATILSGGESSEEVHYLKVALQSALQRAGQSVVDAHLNMEKAVGDARQAWEVEVTARERDAVERGRQEAEEVHAEAAQRAAEQAADEARRMRIDFVLRGRQRDRQTARRFMSLEQEVLRSMAPVESLCSAKLAEFAGDVSAAGPVSPPVRTAPPIDPPMPGGMTPDEELEYEAALPDLNLEAFSADAVAAIASKLRGLLRAATVSFAAVHDAHQKHVDRLNDDLREAAQEIEEREQELQEVRDELDAIYRERAGRPTERTQTELTGEQLDEDRRRLEAAVEATAAANAALAAAAEELSACRESHSAETDRRAASEQQLSNTLARVARAASAWPEPLASFLLSFAHRVPLPVLQLLPEPMLSDAELDEPVPMPPLQAQRPMTPMSSTAVVSLNSSSPLKCGGLAVVSLSTGMKSYDDQRAGGGYVEAPVGSILSKLPQLRAGQPGAGLLDRPASADQPLSVDRALNVRRIAAKRRPRLRTVSPTHSPAVPLLLSRRSSRPIMHTFSRSVQ